MVDKVILEAPAGTFTTLHDVNPTGGVNALGYALKRAEGLFGLAGVRDATHDRVGAHGSIDRTRWLSDKSIALEGEVWGASRDVVASRERAIEAAMMATLEAPGTLRWWLSDGGLALQAAVKYAGSHDVPLENYGRLLDYQLQLRKPDPRSYSQTLATVVSAALSTAGGGLMFPFTWPLRFTPSGGGVANVVNNGNTPTPLKARLYGWAVAPRLRLQSTGEELVFTGEIGAGDYLEIDCTQPAPTIRLNGNAARATMLDQASSTFFEIPKGPQVLQMLASNFDAGAHVAIDGRDAYAGS